MLPLSPRNSRPSNSHSEHTLPRSIIPPATALQLDMSLLLMQSVNRQIFLETPV
jgi:hypothetical protein